MDNAALLRNALLVTDPELNKLIDGQISWWNSIRKRGARVHKYRNYERGDHDANITDQMRNMLRLKADDAAMNDFNDNYMGMVIDKMVARIVVSEILTDSEAIDKNWLQPMLQERDFKAAQAMWWRSATRDGDAFVMVDLETGLWTTEPAYDGFSGMTAIFDAKTRKPLWGCKMWAETDILDKPQVDQTVQSNTVRTRMHLIVFQPGRVSYWTGLEGTLQVDPENPDALGVPLSPEGAPQGTGAALEVKNTDPNVRLLPAELSEALPFVAFANKRDSFTRYGDSELRVAIPLQDVLNRTLYSMVMASEFAAFGVNWSIGFEIDPAGIVPGGIVNLFLKDSSGKVITDFTPEQVSFISACKVGQFPATQIAQYISQIEMLVEEIGQATQTPIQGRTSSGVISGSALQQLESGLISKVTRFQEQNTDAVKSLIKLTAQIERIYHPEKGAPELKTVDVQWKTPIILDIPAEITNLYTMKEKTASMWSDDFYRRKIGALLGMSKEDIDREAQAAEEQKQENMNMMNDAATALAAANAAKAGPPAPGQPKNTEKPVPSASTQKPPTPIKAAPNAPAVNK
jgi:hypothetical protein